MQPYTLRQPAGRPNDVPAAIGVSGVLEVMGHQQESLGQGKITVFEVVYI
jgi:hypothetical protein